MGVEVIETIEVKPVAEKQTVSFLHSFGQILLLKRTLMLWLIWFGIVYSYYGIFTWLPSLLVKEGYTIAQFT